MRLLYLFVLSNFSYHAIGQSLCGGAQTFRILHFTKTNGFDHNTRGVSNGLFTAIGSDENFTVYNTNDASIFDELDSLLQFAVIVFSNTSGNNLLTSTQQANAEAYYATGRGFLGIHAATDTYRNGSWPFYQDLVGAIVQSNPNHTSQNHVDTMVHEVTHAVLDMIPNPWIKEEEYYYWDLNGGLIDTINFTTALRVFPTGTNSYDRTRPITWFRSYTNGSRSFYTALGHKSINYTSDSNFRQLIRNGLCWTADAAGNQTSSAVDPSLDVEKDIVFKNHIHGVVLISPDGNCWRVQVGNDGQLTTVAINCPSE